jgi:hypothetical protein
VTGKVCRDLAASGAVHRKAEDRRVLGRTRATLPPLPGLRFSMVNIADAATSLDGAYWPFSTDGTI